MSRFIRTFLFLLSACFVAFSCTEPGPDVPPVDDSSYYSVNGERHAISEATLYYSKGEGYNLVFAEEVADLCANYNLLNDRTISLFNVDIPEYMMDTEVEFDGTDLSTEDWMFYVVSWDASSYTQKSMYVPVSGSIRVERKGESVIASLSAVDEDDNRYELKYEGSIRSMSDYVWCGFLDGGSFTIDGKTVVSYTSKLFYSEADKGYNFAVFGETDTIIVDFPEFMVGKCSVVGNDKFSDDDTEWSFVSRSLLDGKKLTFIDLKEDFESGWFSCHHIDKEKTNLGIDMDMRTTDGHDISMHFHGPYTVSSGYQIF